MSSRAWAARLRRHLEAYDLEINIDCKSFPDLIERADFRPAIFEGEISSGVVLESDGIYVYSEEEIFGEPRAHRRVKPRVKGAALLAHRPDYARAVNGGLDARGRAETAYVKIET